MFGRFIQRAFRQAQRPLWKLENGLRNKANQQAIESLTIPIGDWGNGGFRWFFYPKGFTISILSPNALMMLYKVEMVGSISPFSILEM